MIKKINGNFATAIQREIKKAVEEGTESFLVPTKGYITKDESGEAPTELPTLIANVSIALSVEQGGAFLVKATADLSQDTEYNYLLLTNEQDDVLVSIELDLKKDNVVREEILLYFKDISELDCTQNA